MMKEAIAEYKQALETADVNDDQLFYVLVNLGIDLLSLSIADVARMFDTSQPTVTRWAYGRCAPHPAMRKPIYDEFLKKINQ